MTPPQLLLSFASALAWYDSRAGIDTQLLTKPMVCSFALRFALNVHFWVLTNTWCPAASYKTGSSPQDPQSSDPSPPQPPRPPLIFHHLHSLPFLERSMVGTPQFAAFAAWRL